MKICRILLRLAALGLALAPTLGRAAVPDEGDRLGGRVTARIGERTVTFPTLRTDVKADLQGDLAKVVVTQTFLNPANVPLNATYLFPLNKDAAVYRMKMEVADEVIWAVIRKKEEARAEFEAAKREGKAAALLEQHRPNMFTQEIANLMPGQPVKITLEYTQAVPRVRGAYELVVPLVVGPRYRPAHHRDQRRVAMLPGGVADDPITPPAPVPARPQFGAWQLGPVPKYPEVSGLTIPPTVAQDRVSIEVALSSGLPIAEAGSTTHALESSGGERSRTFKLARGRTIDNKDFVLRYRLAGAAPQAGLLAHRDARGGFFSLMIEPPAVPKADAIAPREIVFILDTSGSMSGAPIAASKTFMRHALKGLRPGDHFRIISFSNSASEFAAQPVKASPRNVAAGLAYVNGLSANGGTEMMSGLRLAYGAAASPHTLRLIVFLSDGYVSNDPEVLRQVASNVGAGRMYTFGVGTSVNRYLIAEMARLGRGRYRIIDPTQKGDDAAIAFADTIATPVLTDISIDWGDLKPTGVTPDRIPDLFDGGAIRVQGRFENGGNHVIKIKGKVNGREAMMPLQISLPATKSAEARAAIPVLWARSRVADHMRELMAPASRRPSGMTDDILKARITKLGLDFSLVTQWTSFVAVATKIVNPNPSTSEDRSVPLNQVDGVGPEAYGLSGVSPAGRVVPQGGGAPNPLIKASRRVRFAANQPSRQVFGGGATPEPEQVLGLGLILVLLWARFRRLFFRRARRAAC